MHQVSSASAYEYPQSQISTTNNLPYVEVVEQPSPNTLRFRYACEKRSAGCIIGVNSTPEKKTFPSIRVHGYQGKAVVVISCVTKDNPPKPHPHSVIGKDSCENGVCTMKFNLSAGGIISFGNLGIQCVKKKEVRDALAIRKRERVDPFSTGYEHMNFPDSIDLNVVRLSFQVFIQGSDKKYTVPLKSVATCLIYDKKAIEVPVIVKLSHHSAPVSGGTNMILLCGKVCKDDIQVRFFEMRDNWPFWDGYGEFRPSEIHKQVAISFRTPRYCNQDISEPVTVYIQLRKKSDGTTSKPVPFQMLPLDLDDKNSLKRKRIKLNYDPKTYMAKQIQAQAQKQGNILNHALLLNSRDVIKHQPCREMPVLFRGEEVHPRPTPIFQEQASALPVPQATHQERIHYNIPFNQQHNYEREGRSHLCNEVPVTEPQFLTSSFLPQAQGRMDIPFSQQQHSLEREGCLQPNYQIPVPQPRVLTCPPPAQPLQPRQPKPRPQPRRRTEPPPPNVTINSFVYLESPFSNYHQPEPQATPQYSSNQQQMVTDQLHDGNNDDPFMLQDLPYDLDQLSQQDLQLDLLETTDPDNVEDNVSETLSETLSKGLSISVDDIENTFQNIHELNKEIPESQRQGQVQFAENIERRDLSAVGPSFNAFARHNFDNHMDQAQEKRSGLDFMRS